MDFGFCEDSNEFVEKDPTGRKTSNIERLISEARLLKSLKAEYIIKFYDFWIDDEKKNLNLITVIFVSVSLSQYCKKHKGVTTKAMKNWARQILRGFHYLQTRETSSYYSWLFEIR
ncbi:hypothetical protein OIU76_008923 [Salix suchowensis]|nr:hypothetical protein OIU76_008923 [Salix suchowensis]